MLLLLVIYLGVSILMMLLSIPMIQKRIKPNRWYGFRTRKTLSSPDIWYPANAYAGKILLVQSAVIFVAALLLYVVPNMSEDGYTLSFSLVLLCSLMPAIGLMFGYLRRL